MKVLVAGANGQIGRKIVKMLSESDHQVRVMIRNEDQKDVMKKLGADEIVIADLEGDISQAVKGCSTVIFTAGSGPHTGPDKTELVDKQGAMKLVDAAVEEGADRYVMVSSRNADNWENTNSKIRYYYEAKGKADEYLRSSNLNYTIIRPGGLTNDNGTGLVLAREHLQEDDISGSIPRQDVAAAVVSALDEDNTFYRSFDLVSGKIPINEALSDL
jgi:uncharacterized protein YbjT (DUF2867 family)